MRSEDTPRRSLSFTFTAGAVIIIIAVIFIAGTFMIRRNRPESEPQIITQARLEKIINVSELSTFETIYNGIAEVNNKENPEQVDYYVYYESRVKTGIDFSQVIIDVDDENKRITVQLPEIIITDTNVDIASLDYIFENKKANTPTVSQEAYKACLEDVKKESANEKDIYELARQNAERIVRALIRPFVEQVDAEYELEIN